MKKYFSSLAIIGISVILIPAVPVISGLRPCAVSQNFSNADNPQISYSYSLKPYRVLDIETNTVNEVPVREYVIGAVCAEMPADFEIEAIKAQAVSAHTYAERQRSNARENPDESLNGADFSNDTSKYQGYFSEKQIKDSYGENFDEYYKKISSAVDEVLNYIITFDNMPIISAFHSMSSGITESAENVWGTPTPYLVPVDSSYDKSAPKYLDEKSFSPEELKNILEESFPEVNLQEDFTDWIKINSVSDSGTVLSAQVGNLTLSGGELRSALGLRSACFDIDFSENSVTFTTKGFGHGVGMSQYGANSMAQDGKNWREILSHYYPTAVITDTSAL